MLLRSLGCNIAAKAPARSLRSADLLLCPLCPRKRISRSVRPLSHPENLGVLRLDLLGLCQHRSGISLEQFDRGERGPPRLLLYEPVERVMREAIEKELLCFDAEQKALKQPRGMRIWCALEYARGHGD